MLVSGLQNIGNEMLPSRSRLVATRYYYGDGTVCRGDSVVMTRFGGGYFDGAGKPCYELADYQGNISTVIDSDGAIVSHTGFYPYGQPWRRPGELQWLYGGKEWLGADGRDEYDFHARRQYPHLGRFTTPDPLAELAYDVSIYSYCHANPVNIIDPTGMTDLVDGNGWYEFFDDGIHQVIQVTTAELQEITKDKLSVTSERFKEIVNGGEIRNDLNPTVKDVIAAKNGEIVTWPKHVDNPNPNCFTLAQKQSNSKISGERIDAYGTNDANNNEAADYTREQLKQGNSVVAGVGSGGQTSNSNPSTTHFLTIVGMGFNENGNYFTYYDNAFGNPNNVTNLDNNRLYLNPKENLYEGTSTRNNIPIRYKLTEVRKNK